MTTCDSRTGIDSPSSIARCSRTATCALISTVRPSLSKNRKPYLDPLVGGLAQAHDVLLGGALRGQEGQAGVAVLGGQAPGAGVEVELPGVIGHGEVDVPQVGDQALGHVVPRVGVRRAG
jgi:hypothetical protein